MQQGKSSLSLRDEDEDSEDDEVLELKDRLAAYNLGSSPDHSDGKFSLLNSLGFFYMEIFLWETPKPRISMEKFWLKQVLPHGNSMQLNASEVEKYLTLMCGIHSALGIILGLFHEKEVQ